MVRRIRVKTVLALAGAIVVIALIAYPYVTRFLGMSIRLSWMRAESKMTLVGKVVRDYRAVHEGSVPASYEELSRCVRAHPEYDVAVHGPIDGGDFQYFPSAKSDRPLATKYIAYGGSKDLLLWMDSGGDVHMSRVWMWRTYKRYDP